MPVCLDGRGPYWFALDTGSSATVVSRQLAADLALERRAVRIAVLGADGDSIFNREVVRVGSLGVGAATFQDWDACVLDLSHLRQALGRLDGILGYPTFRGCRVVVDYPGRQVVVSRGPRLDPARTDVVRTGAGRLPRVTLPFGEEQVDLIVDTGSAEALALPQSLESALTFTASPVSGHRGSTIAGTGLRSRVARLGHDLDLAGYRVVRPLVFLTPGPPRIGGAILRNFRVTFDLDAGLMRLSRRSTEPLTTEGLRSPGIAIRPSSDGWFVSDVIPETAAAAAGLEAGDRVVSINGVPGSELTRLRWRRLCAGPDALHLVLLRGSTVIQLMLRVTDIVR